MHTYRYTILSRSLSSLLPYIPRLLSFTFVTSCLFARIKSSVHSFFRTLPHYLERSGSLTSARASICPTYHDHLCVTPTTNAQQLNATSQHVSPCFAKIARSLPVLRSDLARAAGHSSLGSTYRVPRRQQFLLSPTPSPLSFTLRPVLRTATLSLLTNKHAVLSIPNMVYCLRSSRPSNWLVFVCLV
jgi:hypothetical protein